MQNQLRDMIPPLSQILAALKSERPISKSSAVGGKSQEHELLEVNVEEQKQQQEHDRGFLSHLIQEREEALARIEKMMADLAQLANEMAQEVNDQEGKFEQIGENVRSTKDNARGALTEIKETAERRKIGCCTW